MNINMKMTEPDLAWMRPPYLEWTASCRDLIRDSLMRSRYRPNEPEATDAAQAGCEHAARHGAKTEDLFVQFARKKARSALIDIHRRSKAALQLRAPRRSAPQTVDPWALTAHLDDW